MIPYSKSTVTVTPGSPYTVTVGGGSSSYSSSSAGGDSWFGSSTTVMAKGGSSVNDNTFDGASGGLASAGYGTVRWSGGSGANGSNGNGNGGGGGSSAGTLAIGNNGITNTNIGATAPAGGGNGGNGASGSNGAGVNGQVPGGGGGAYVANGNGVLVGGSGANGQVRITYTPVTPAITPHSNPSVCQGTTSVSITYTANAGCPDQYSIGFDAAAKAAGFINVPWTTLPASPITIIVPANVASGTYNGTLKVGNSSTSTSTGGYAISVTVTSDTWTGAISSAWDNIGNWCGGIPTATTDVIIPSSVPYQPIITAAVSGSCNSIEINSGATVTISGALNVATTITNNANISGIIVKSSTSVPNGSLIFHNASTQPVKATVEMYSKATRNSIGITVGGRTYYYTWQYFGTPLSSVVADPTFYGSFIRMNYENSKDTLGKWTSLANTDVLSPFKGYEITQDAPTTIVFQGQLVNKDTTIILPYTSDAYDPGQTILANPYTAAIDVRQLIFDDNAEKTVYLYNTGSFGQWFNNSGESTYTESTNTPGQYIAIPQRAAGDMGLPNDIPSMSGYLVKAKGVAGGKLTINYNSVVIKNINVQRAPQSQNSSDKVYMDISLKSEHAGDRMWLINEPGTTRDFDNGWDGYKLSGAVGTPKLFAMEESGNYQISTSDDMNNTYLGFQAGVDLEDTLTFKNENVESKYDGVYLVDLIENKVIDITKSGTQYIFKTESTPAPIKRFKIVTEPYVKNAADLTTKLKVFNDNNIVFIDNPGSEKGELYFYDVMGHYLKKEIFGSNSISSFPLLYMSGVYIVKAVTGSEKVSKQFIVKQ